MPDWAATVSAAASTASRAARLMRTPRKRQPSVHIHEGITVRSRGHQPIGGSLSKEISALRATARPLGWATTWTRRILTVNRIIRHQGESHMRRRVFVAAAIGGVAAIGIGIGAAPAFSAPASHTITFTSHNLAALQTGSNHLLQDSELQRGGHIIGYSTSTCAFDLSTGIATCDVAASVRSRPARRPGSHRHQGRHRERHHHRRDRDLSTYHRHHHRRPQRNTTRRRGPHYPLPHPLEKTRPRRSTRRGRTPRLAAWPSSSGGTFVRDRTLLPTRQGSERLPLVERKRPLNDLHLVGRPPQRLVPGGEGDALFGSVLSLVTTPSSLRS